MNFSLTTSVDNEDRFCDWSSILKVQQHLSQDAYGSNKLAFLVLSGSFNPVHTQHIRMLILTRQYLELFGWTVVGGFLAPSEDHYVQQKFLAEALPLQQRTALCSLAIKEYDWMNVCVKGEFSSKWVCNGIRTELEYYCFDILQGRLITGVEIMGSDSVVRIFNKVLESSDSRDRKLLAQRRIICCLLRPGQESASQRKHIQSVLIPGVMDMGVQIILPDPATFDPPLEEVSSSAIRKLVSTGSWDILESTGWLHPDVFKAFHAKE
jgi:hypothetical protein